jgi:gliding motility-associated-like protein
MNNTGAGYQCCSQNQSYTCEQFSITTNNASIAFRVSSPNLTGNISINVNDCSTPIALDSFFCITGGAIVNVSICSDNLGSFDLIFETIGAPTITNPQNTTINCQGFLFAEGLDAGTISINSLAPGNSGDYNNLFDCSVNCFSPSVFSPIIGSPSTITYSVCGNVIQPNCYQGIYTYCDTISIDTHNPLTLTGLNNQTFCAGSNSPTLTATVSGGLPPYTYEWQGPNIILGSGPNSNTISNTIEGTYILTVLDSTGCSISDTVQIDEIPVPLVNAGGNLDFCTPNINQLSFNASATNETNLSWSGGLGGFDDNTILQPTYTLDPSEQSVGSFILTLIGSNVCGANTSTTTVTFYTTNGLQISSQQTNITCFGDTTGAIDITVINGTGNEAFSWNNGANVADLTNQPVGIYILNISDTLSGCVTSDTFNLTHLNPGPIFSVNGFGLNPTCFGVNDGGIVTNLNGGIGPYVYTWANNLGSSPTLDSLGPGVYSLSVQDSLGCIATLNQTLVSPSELLISGLVSNVDCSGNENGAIDVTISGGIPTYSINWTPGNIQFEDLTDLNGGTYVIVVSDQNGCSKSDTFTVNEPSFLSATFTSGNVSCFGLNDGFIDVTPSGGTVPYSYTWNNGQITQDLLNTVAGNYLLTLTDSAGCSLLLPVTITEPPQIELNETISNVSCAGLADGYLILNASGGNGNYSYLWSPNGEIIDSIGGLNAGTYGVTVTDVTNCSTSQNFTITEPLPLTASFNILSPILCFGGTATVDVSATGGTPTYSNIGTFLLPSGTNIFFIEDIYDCQTSLNIILSEPPQLTLSSSVTNVTCFGNASGQIDISIGGGILPYSYLWNTNQTTQDITNLTAGNYSVIVTDSNGCTDIFNTSITQPSALAAAFSNTNILCNGDSTGAINLSITGGVGPYTQLWSNNATSEDLSGLATGAYSVTVTDASGCPATFNTSLTQPAVLAAIFSNTNILCNGDSTGAIDLSISGGTSPYSQLWSNNATSEDLNGLAAGAYSVTVTDSSGCTDIFNTSITQPSALTAAFSNTNILCNGDSTGAINLSITGGVGPYTQLWSNNATSEDLSGLATGAYSVTVTDSSGCTITDSASVNQPSAISLSTLVSDVACFGSASGAIDLSVAGATPGYTYSWNNGSQTEDLGGVVAGTYSVTVTDANGCVDSTSATVNEPAALIANSTITTPITVNGGLGIITVSANGGILPYQGIGNDTVQSGTYQYVVTDANGCTDTTIITITEPNQLVANATINTLILCNGDSANVSVSATGGQAPYTGIGTFTLPAGSYNFTVTDSFNVIAITSITISEPSALTASISGANVTCNGLNNGSATITASGGVAPYTYSWSNSSINDSVSNLAPGNYTVTVVDANGCSTSQSVIITEPVILTASSTEVNPILCNGDTAIVSVLAQGGTLPYVGTGSFSVVAGTFTYTVTDGNNCSASTSIVITEPTILSASITGIDVTCNGAANGSITSSVSGGTQPYAYLWSNGATTSSITNLTPGSYTLVVTDTNGCSVNSTQLITEPVILTAASTVTSSILCQGGQGVVTVSANGGTIPFSGTGTYNVNAGFYTYTVTDNNGCIAQTNINVSEPAQVQANAVISQAILCNGGTGQITVNAIGGVGPYSGTGGQSVIAGNYSYIVSDANSCSDTVNISITQPVTLAVNVNGTNPLCNSSANGSALANVSGGTAPYAYLWSNGNTTNTANSLTAGTYTVQITDTNGCVISGSVTLTQPGTLSANAIISSAILCNGGSAQVLVSANGGTAPYSGIGQFSALAGNATYTVTDANACTATASINVPEPSALVVNAAIASPIACFGGNGNIIVTAAGGTPSYTGTGSYSVSVGTYTYPVTDINGCLTSATITINQPTALIANAVIVTPIACNGGTATILVSGVGGTPNYTGTGNFNAPVGVQSYTVIDANGCSSNTSINVNQPSILTSSISSQNVTCNGLNNGSAVVTANGGTPNYSYLWSNGATTASVSNLAPGAYSVTVTDANGCQSVSNVNITQPTVLTSAVVQTANILCFGGTGSVFVSANGGSAPYIGTGSQSVVAGNQSFTITDANGCTSTSSILITQPTQLIASATQITPVLCFGGQATVAVTGIGGTVAYSGTGSFNSFAGNNSYTIQDANGCTSSTTLLISQPTAVTATFNNTSVTCFGLSNGSSTASVTGGTPGYTYLWNTGSTTSSINNQLAGNYALQVTDANGCIFNLNTTITQPTPIVATANVILPIACFGGQAIVLVNGAGGTPGYTGNGTFNEFAGIHTYVLIDQNGCVDSTTITVTQPAAFTAVASITSPIACNGGQATVVVTGTGGTAPYTGTGTFIVTPGTYAYTIIDANGCSATTTITVTQPAVLSATATIISPILCNGGTAQVQVSAIGGSLPYSGTGIFTVVSGTFNYLVTDGNGCNANTSISVPQPPLLVTNVVSTNITCFGANNGSAIVFNSGGVAPLSVLWSNGSTSNSIAGLSPGNYSVTVTDANGCQNVNPFIITQPTSLIASANQISPILCFNGNATVTVSAVGGTAPYAGIGTFFPIAGSYNYIVTDAQGCIDTAAIIVTQPAALSVTATIVSPIACFGGQATVNVAANGGVAPYTGIGNFNVSSGNQSFTVTDANGCAFVVSLFVPQPAPLISPISAQNVSCFNTGNGSATANPIGGTPGYQYTWSTGGAGQTINNLIPGLYTVTVIDANGCQTTNQITITQPTQLSINATLSSPVFCFGGNALVSISANGGTPTYTGTGNFNQAAGTTTYYVTDANGCIDSIAFTVVQPAQLIASVLQTTNVLCFGGTATVFVSATGGTPSLSGIGNFTVSAGWNSYTVTDNYGCQDTTSIFIVQPTLLVANATQTSAVLCNGGNAVINVSASGGTPGYIGQGNFTVIAGTYTYTVSDANGCTANTTISISQPNPLQAIANVTSPIVCNAGTGVITITGAGGTAPYTGTGTFTVVAGTYTYPIVDANGCSSAVTITITQAPVLTLSLTQTNVNCNGFATGSITANPAGGQGPYTYLWSNSQTTQTVSNLLAGAYIVVVTDNLGCTVNGNTTITQPLAPILLQESHTNILCYGNNTGSIDLSVSGGTSPYTYSWSNSATTQDIQNLIAGTYNVTVTDANGCIAVMSINVTQPAIPLSVGYTTTNVSCFGLSDGSIDVTPLGGSGPFTYFWTTGLASQDLSNIPAGQYIIAITDANNCVTSTQITVGQPTAPLSGTITQLPITCYGANDGQLTANANGGTAPYAYTWSPSGQTGSIASMLAPGTYVVSIVDANGCTAAATDVLATPPSLIAQMNISDNIVCLPSIATVTNASVGTFNNVLWTLSNGQSYTSNQFTLNLNSIGCIDITLLITNANGCTADTTISNAICVIPGPTAAFSTASPEIDFSTGELSFINNSINYIGSIWQFGDGTSATLDNPIHTYPAATIDSYNVMLVVYDANGCSDTAYSVVESNDLVRLTVPNGFTPNGDGLNDIFIPVVSNSDQIKFYRFEVYNRWGQLIFESTKPGEGWDGKFNGKQAQFGVYNWIVRFEVPENEPVKANGHVTLIK